MSDTRNEYEAAEVIEIGKAREVILGPDELNDIADGPTPVFGYRKEPSVADRD